jgi:hypothetical protein
MAPNSRAQPTVIEDLRKSKSTVLMPLIFSQYRSLKNFPDE